jgi:hypothetical protein
MNITETKQLLQEVSVIDKRQVSPELIQAWQGILGHIPLDVAQEAHKLARRDSGIQYLEPKHIVVWAKEAAFKLDREQGKQKPQEVLTGTPEPVCREHQARIMSCDPCASKLNKMSHLHDAALLVWARENIYA